MGALLLFIFTTENSIWFKLNIFNYNLNIKDELERQQDEEAVKSDENMIYVFEKIVNNPYENLFLWCILFNRVELAKVLLPKLKVI